jgi:hypothetical protein
MVASPSRGFTVPEGPDLPNVPVGPEGFALDDGRREQLLAREALTRTWAKLGFGTVANDVIMLNLTTTTSEERLDTLLRALR